MTQHEIQERARYNYELKKERKQNSAHLIAKGKHGIKNIDRHTSADTLLLKNGYDLNGNKKRKQKPSKKKVAAKRKKNYKPMSMLYHFTPYMSMLTDRPKIESEENRSIRIMDRQIHRMNVYK